MMQIQQNKTIIKIIQITKGHILSPFSNPQKNIKILIFNQLLNPECSKNKSNISIDLENLNFHKQNPYSLENTSVAWASIQHEIRDVLNSSRNSQEDLLIFDSSQYTKKIPDIFTKFQIVKGYNYRLKKQFYESISEQNLALMNQEHVLKQIQMQFTLGNGSFKPGYIGEINFEEIQNTMLDGTIKAYIKYSSKTNCPIVLNFTSSNQEAYMPIFQECSHQIIERLQNKLKLLQNFLKIAKEANCSQNIIVYNLPIVLLMSKKEFFCSNHFEDSFHYLLKQYQIKAGFNLLRYNAFNDKFGLNQIIKLIKNHSKQVIISSNINYKTDLLLNSGEGYSLYSQSQQRSPNKTNIAHMNSIQYMQSFLQNDIIDRVVRANILELFDWKQKKQEIKVEIFWKCDSCKCDFSESIKAFGKFGKQFCCIKCLKAFKF